MSDENNIYKINLGGFPPIIKIDNAMDMCMVYECDK